LNKNDDNNGEKKNLQLLEEPNFICFFYDGKSEYTPVYQIGFQNNQPIFRMSRTCARRK
jgi:hypothetical protein